MSLRSVWSKLLGVFSSGKSDAEFEEEIAAHLEAAAADYLASGMSAKEARRPSLRGPPAAPVSWLLYRRRAEPGSGNRRYDRDL